MHRKNFLNSLFLGCEYLSLHGPLNYSLKSSCCFEGTYQEVAYWMEIIIYLIVIPIHSTILFGKLLISFFVIFIWKKSTVFFSQKKSIIFIGLPVFHFLRLLCANFPTKTPLLDADQTEFF